MLEPIRGDGYTEDRTDPDRAWGAVDMESRTGHPSEGELDLSSLDFLDFVEMVRESSPNGSGER